MTKRCPKCGRDLPLASFHRNRRNRDGRADACRECTSTYSKLHRPRWKEIRAGLRKPDTERRWEESLALLRRFVEREGHARVPPVHVEDGFVLGRWVSCQRGRRWSGRLPAPRARTLESLPGWSWHPFDDDFQRGLAALRRYVEREGHAWVPHRHEEAGFPLGQWAASRRRDHRVERLSAERAAALEAVPGWAWRRSGGRARGLKNSREAIEALRDFAARTGHLDIPGRWQIGGIDVGAWVKARRRDYRKGQLHPGLAHRLESIPGWSWEQPRDGFERGFRLLRRYVDRHGHACPPHHQLEDGFRLGWWVAVKRRQYKQRSLAAERIARLEALPGWVWDARRPFQSFLVALRRFAEREGHTRPPKSHREGGIRLGSWVAKLRREYRAGRLQDEHRRALEAVPGWTRRVSTAALAEPRRIEDAPRSAILRRLKR